MGFIVLVLSEKERDILVNATRDFYTCKIRDSDTIKSHVARFRMLRTQLITAGQTVSKLQSVVALLMSLPERYCAFVSTQNHSISAAVTTATAGAAQTITLSDIISALLNEEATHRQQRSTPSSSARALYASQGRGRRFQPSRPSPFLGNSNSKTTMNQ